MDPAGAFYGGRSGRLGVKAYVQGVWQGDKDFINFTDYFFPFSLFYPLLLCLLFFSQVFPETYGEVLAV